MPQTGGAGSPRLCRPHPSRHQPLDNAVVRNRLADHVRRPTNGFGKSDPMCEYLRRRRNENQPRRETRDLGTWGETTWLGLEPSNSALLKRWCAGWRLSRFEQGRANRFWRERNRSQIRPRRKRSGKSGPSASTKVSRNSVRAGRSRSPLG